MKKLIFVTAVMALTACDGADNASDINADSVLTDEASAPSLMIQQFSVMNSAGNEIGTATIADEAEGGVSIQLDITAIPEGSHAIHFHETGACDTPDFKSAGGHYNPVAANHGFQSTAPNPHAGDMRNFDAPASGVVSTDIDNERVTLSPRDGLAPLFDENGTALIIHASADDYKTQPTGAAGSRIACAIIAP